MLEGLKTIKSNKGSLTSEIQQKWRIWIILFAISIVVTLPGLTQGLDAIPEDIKRVAIAVHIADTGDLDPHWYGHPGSVLIYMLSTLFKANHIIQREQVSLTQNYFNSPDNLLLTARWLSRAVTGLMVIASYELATKVLGKQWGLITALVISINPLIITHAHRGRSDNLLTLFITIIIYVLIKAQERDTEPHHLNLVFLITGLATSIKYTALGLMPTNLLWIITRKGVNANTIKKIAKLLAISLAIFMLTSPYVVFNASDSLNDILSEKTKGIDSLDKYIKFGRALIKSTTWVGAILLILPIINAAGALQKKGIKAAREFLGNQPTSAINTVMICIASYLSFTLINASTFQETWITPIVPEIMICVCAQIKNLHEQRNFFTIPGKLISAVIQIIFIAIYVPTDIEITRVRLQNTSIENAEQWLKSNIESGSKIALVTPNNKNVIFPRIKSFEPKLFAFKNGEDSYRICSGELGYNYIPQKTRPYKDRDCFPRPRLNSNYAKSVEMLLGEYDAVIIASRPSEYINYEHTTKKPTAVFTAPWRIHSENWSRNPLPFGDYGNWSNIYVFQK